MLTIEVTLDTQGLGLKQVISEQTDISVDQLKLICGGQVIANENSLASYNIKVYIVVKTDASGL